MSETDDWALSQGTVDERNEARRPSNQMPPKAKLRESGHITVTVDIPANPSFFCAVRYKNALPLSPEGLRQTVQVALEEAIKISQSEDISVSA